MNRFQRTSKNTSLVKRLVPVLLFFIVILAFLAATSYVSDSTARQEAEGLEDSIRKSTVHCYALEGSYPENLEYLEENYGISYDHEKYVVSYEIIGENLMPDIMVIPIQNKGGKN